MSSGYEFWSDMSIGDFLNGKVKSVNIYVRYLISIFICLNRIIFYFLCIQISYVTKNLLFKKCCCFLFLNLKPGTGE